MKKWMSALILSLALAVGLVPATAQAAGNVAKIGTTEYATLAEAVAACDGDTIVLLQDVTESITVAADSWVILDLAGNTLTNTAGSHTIINNGTLDIKDTVGGGVVDNVTHQRAALVNGGSAVLYAGTFTRSLEDPNNTGVQPGSNSYYTIMNLNGGEMVIKANVTVLNKGHFSSMIINGDQNSLQPANLFIEGGTFSGGINTIKNGEYGILAILDGEFSNTSQYVVMNWNKAEISGGTFETASTATKAVLFSSSYAGCEASGELIVLDGTFTAQDGQPIFEDAYDENNVGTVSVSGGNFNAEVPAKHIAEGSGLIMNNDGSFGVIPAVNAVAITVTAPQSGQLPDWNPVVTPATEVELLTVPGVGNYMQWAIFVNTLGTGDKDDPNNYREMAENETFQAGNTYVATIFVVEKAGYVITADTTVTINGAEPTRAYNMGATYPYASNRWEIPEIPVITAGVNQTWVKGSDTGLSFTSSAPYNMFINAHVDSTQLTAEQYTVAEGSTIVTLNAAFLETLGLGSHTIYVESATGTAATTFTVANPNVHNHMDLNGDGKCDACGEAIQPITPVVPATGDATSVALFAAMIAVARAGILIARKKVMSK